MNFLLPLVDWHFWFTMTPVRMAASFEAVFFGLFALCLVAGAVIRMMVRNAKYDKYQAMTLQKIASVCSWAGVTGLLWFFLTFEEVQFFGSRFWFLIWIIGVCVALAMILRYFKKEVPLLKHREQSRAEVNKYLPRRHR